MNWSRFFSKEKAEIDAMQNPGDKDMLHQNIGGNTQKIDIRILYPRGKDDGSLLLSDILAVLITVCLEKLKGETNGRIIVGDVKIDRKGGSRKDTIFKDIRDPNCYIIIILSKDVARKSNHQAFEDELNEVLQVLENKSKPEKMFLPIYMCSREKLKLKSETIKKILELVTEGEPLINSPVLKTTWVENVIFDEHISKLSEK